MDISPSPSPARRGGFRLWSSIIGVIAVAAILVGINMVADTQAANAQLDLTQQHLFTLSPGTRTILAGLKEPVTLRLYYSRALGARIPVYGAYADRVREMLEQYARLSDGKVRLEFYNPEPFSDTEDRAVAYGLQGVPVDNSGEQVYFGLVGTNLLDDERTVPFFQPERERFLEYDLSRLIYELSNPKRPVIGVMSSLPLDGDPRMMMMNRGQGGAGGPWASMMLLRQSFDVKNVATDAISIDPDVQVLLVAQAQHLSDATQYAIDQFVMRGGRLMVMVDPYSDAEASQPSQTGMPNSDVSSDLKKLFDAWGITFDPKVVAGAGVLDRPDSGGGLRGLVQHRRRHRQGRSRDRRSQPGDGGHRRHARQEGRFRHRVYAVAEILRPVGDDTGQPVRSDDRPGEASGRF
jgi:ABC-type uncharacterized transport system involved in gliding motility auxiliary subunit